MKIERHENRTEKELTLRMEGTLGFDGAEALKTEITEAINDIWQKIILDLSETEDIDVYGLKMLWDVKSLANRRQKGLELKSPSARAALTLGFTGFYQIFGIVVSIDKPTAKSVIALGQYGEPLYEGEAPGDELIWNDKVFAANILTEVISDLDSGTKYGILNWTMAPDPAENRMIFFIDAEDADACDGEDAETLTAASVEKHLDIKADCSVYILEKGSFEKYLMGKRVCGVPEKLARIRKVIYNPSDKKYFLDRIDERY